MEYLSTAQAAKQKGCTPQAIWGAIKRGDIDGQQVGRSYNVSANKKFKEWQPNPIRQKARLGKTHQ